MTAPVLLEEVDQVAILTLNRAEHENVLTDEVVDAFMTALDGLAAREAPPHALIITSAGEEIFIIGADPNAVVGFDAEAARRASQRGQALADRIATMPMPVIAAVNGMAIGGGLEMVVACDLVIASATAQFFQLECAIGLVPGFGGTWRLQRRVGRARAKWLTYVAAPIAADQALAWGLADEVVPPGELRGRALALAQQIAANDPRAVRLAKGLIDSGGSIPQAESHALEAAAFARLAGTESLKARVTALMAARAAAREAQGS